MPPIGAPRTSLKVKSVVTLGDLSPEWDRLVDLQALPTPFLKSWWLDGVAVGRPEILCFFDHDELVGGAAFEVDQVSLGPISVERVRCLGQGVLAPDHLDVIGTAATIDEVLNGTLEWLRRPGSRVIDLDGLSAEGRLGRSLAAHEITRIAAPVASLKGGAADYLAGRPGKVRSTAKRGRNRLAKSGITLDRVDSSDAAEVERALDTLAELHDGRWSEQSRFLEAFDRFRVAAAKGVSSGDVLMYELSGEEAGVIAVEMDLLAGDRVCFYQAGRRTDHEWRGSGTVLRAGIIEAVASEGQTEYDLLRGDEPYKAEWSTSARELIRCRFGVGPSGRAIATAANAWKRSGPGIVDLYGRAREGVRKGVSRAPWPQRREPRSEQ